MATLTMQQLVGLAEGQGLHGQAAATAAAIAMAESSANTASAGDVGLGGAGPTSFGLWQIHTPAHPEYTQAALASPTTNASAMFKISSGGTNWSPWTTYNTGAYRPFMAAALRAVTAGPASLAATPTASSAIASTGGFAGTANQATASSFKSSDLLYGLLFAGAIATGAIVLGVGINRAGHGTPSRAVKTGGRVAIVAA